MSGPQPTPTKILKLRASWRGDTRHDEPQIESKIPDAPEWMPAQCKPRWDRLTKIMNKIGMIGDNDADHLAQYCWLWWQLEIAMKAAQDTGHILEDPVSGKKIHPNFKVVMELSTQVKQLGREFGLTPSARASMSIDTGKKVKETSKVDGYMKSSAG